MNFVKHSELIGKHAFLSGSKYHWLRYDKEKLEIAYRNALAAERGTELHDFAATCIRLRQKLSHSRKTLNRYVNDAIGFLMTPEQPLRYSDNCFGFADAISFRDNILRIHDFKSGTIPAHMDQLKIYAAIFCLEYHVNPEDIETKLRIYQNDDVISCDPDPKEIRDIMNHIIDADRVINAIKYKEEFL